MSERTLSSSLTTFQVFMKTMEVIDMRYPSIKVALHLFFGAALLVAISRAPAWATPLPKQSSANVALSMKDARNVLRVVGILSRKGYHTKVQVFKISRDTARCKFNDLNAGTWYLRVKAYNAKHEIVYVGESYFKVFPGSETPVNMALSPTTGSAKITTTWNQNEAMPRNMALQFDGYSGYVLFPSAKLLHPRTFTLEIKVKFDTSGEFVPILEEFHDDLWTHADGYGISYEDGGLGMSVAQQSNFGTGTSAKLDVPLHKWIHIACTYDGRHLCAYVDDRLISKRDYFAPVYYGDHEVALGCAFHSHFGGWHYFSGEMDELRIWDYARSEQEIGYSMNTELSGREPGLVGYWDFDHDGSNRLAIDCTGNGNNGILKGGVNFVPVQ
jgi:hypothetical protein